MRRPDLLILVAIWEFITAFLAFIGIGVIAIFGFAAIVDEAERAAVIVGLSVGVVLLFAFIGLAIAGGVGILIGKEWGRIVSIVHAVLTLLNIPVGTVIGVLILVYLSRSDVRDYFVPPPRGGV